MISGPLAPVSTRIGSSPPRIRCPQVDARDVMPMLRPRTRKLDSSSMSIRSRTLISSAIGPPSCSGNDPQLARESSQLAVEVEGGADQREVGERLREVAEQLAGAPDLLGEEAEMVRVGEHLVEDEQRLVQPARAGKRL